jgi:hypothetical protein
VPGLESNSNPSEFKTSTMQIKTQELTKVDSENENTVPHGVLSSAELSQHIYRHPDALAEFGRAGIGGTHSPRFTSERVP